MAFGLRPPRDDWSRILETLSLGPGSDRRFDALLEEIAEMTGLPAGYLYVLDDSGRRFHLERGRNDVDGSVSDGRHSRRAAPMDAAVEGGAGAAFSGPPLELARQADDPVSVVSTPVGPLLSMPLVLGERTVGLLQVGPLVGRGAEARVRRRLEALVLPVAVVVRQAGSEEALRQEATASSARLEAGQKLIGSSLDLERFVSLLIDLALKATGTDAGFVATAADPDAIDLAVRAEQNMPLDFAERVDLSPVTGMFDWTPATSGMLFLRDLDAADRLGARSILAVPLMDGAQPLGVFALINYGDGGTFAEHSLELLETFAEQVRLMLSNGRLFEDFANRYLETLTGLARSLDLRRPHLQDHHYKVSVVAASVAEALDLPPTERKAIATAGRVHDVGMAGIVGSDFEADLQHPLVGATLVAHLPIHPAVGEALATHHEWFDGWGYPHGLKGLSIPMAGRILAVAEFLVEMATGDQVREPWSEERLESELRQRRGSQFDPSVTDAAIRVIPALAAGGAEPGPLVPPEPAGVRVAG